MLRPVLTLAAVGLAGIAVWKLLWLFVLPLFGTLIGVAVLGFKFLLFALVVWAVWRLFFRKPQPAGS